MTAWVLIISLSGAYGYGGLSFQEFTSLDNCHTAGNAIIKENERRHSDQVDWATCVKK